MAPFIKAEMGARSTAAQKMKNPVLMVSLLLYTNCVNCIFAFTQLEKSLLHTADSSRQQSFHFDF
jgi:hypothetical protein